MTTIRNGTQVALAAVATVAAALAATPRAAAAPTPPAFPGAEGFGAGATGGRGGDVMIVDTLEPFGPGSLGDALSPADCRPRTVVFAVSGVIEVPGPRYDMELRCGDLTIAGQTAPGAGITIRGRVDGYGAGGNLIIRHVRFRPPPISTAEGSVDDLGQVYDALQLSGNPNSILDHISASWGSDESFDIYENSPDFTIQWSTIEQSNTEGQPDGPHNDAMIAGPDSPRVSIRHVLMAHMRARCPAMATGPAELINSVIYDCQDGFVHHNPAEGEFHIAGNSFLQGPNHTEFTPIYLDDAEPGGSTYWLFQNEIVAPGQYEGIVDDIAATPLAEAAFAGADPSQVIADPTDFATEAAGYQPAELRAPGAAREAVLTSAGAFPHDEVTQRTTDEVRAGGGTWEPDVPGDLLAGLAPAAPPADADRDGIADEWERARGLDPDDGSDHATAMPSGYTAIEEYVNELADALVGTTPVGPADGPSEPSPGATPTSGAASSSATAPTGRPPTSPAATAAPPVATAAGTGGGGNGDTVAGVALGISVAALVIAVAAAAIAIRRRA